MTNSYAASAYPMQTYPQNTYENKKSNFPSAFGMATVGGVSGGALGFFKNRFPVSQDGEVADTFAKEVFDKNIKQASQETKNYFTQLKNVLKKIDKVKSPEEFKELMKVNKDLIETQCKGISADVLLDSINAGNLKESKNALKKSLESIMDFELIKTKSAIKQVWDSKSKKFVKTSEFCDNKLFEIIKSTKNISQMKKTLKYGGISAGILGGLTLIYKVMTQRSN